MLGQVYRWSIAGIVKVLVLMRELVLDESTGLTYFHFLIFALFVRILYFLYEFIQQVTITTSESESTFKHERRYRN